MNDSKTIAHITEGNMKRSEHTPGPSASQAPRLSAQKPKVVCCLERRMLQ
jgi:hypothetical protein